MYTGGPEYPSHPLLIKHRQHEKFDELLNFIRACLRAYKKFNFKCSEVCMIFDEENLSKIAQRNLNSKLTKLSVKIIQRTGNWSPKNKVERRTFHRRTCIYISVLNCKLLTRFLENFC